MQWSDAQATDRLLQTLHRIAELVPHYGIQDRDPRPTDEEAAARWYATIGSKPAVTLKQQATVCARFDPDQFGETEEQL